LHPKAAKALEKLDANTKARIKEALKELAGNPEKVGKQLKLSDFWSLRIGDYRAIYEMDRDKNQVVVTFIGHRKNVYDDFTKML
ncbi:MAG TPA: type II toxin-antitoxin system RelE/ParE family toxin, partial [Candidatus Bathyarchaeia archaeon]|nr:type II toxin-antitoxin system RelE/ParE family toxin [Candidatus Bathyarchaeia archaeon]